MCLLSDEFLSCAVIFRAKTEVDDVIGMKMDISYDDLGQLIYLSQVHVIMIKKMRPFFFLSETSSSFPRILGNLERS